MKCISVLSKYFPTVTYVVDYVMFSVVTCVVNHATFLFNSIVTFLNLPPTVGPKHSNDESTTCNHNDGSLCRRRELMRTVTTYTNCVNADVCEAVLKNGYTDRSKKSDAYIYIQVNVKVQTTQSNPPQSGTIWSSSGNPPNTESTIC